MFKGGLLGLIPTPVRSAHVFYKVCALGNEPWWMTPEFPASIPEGADSDLRPARG